MSQKRLRRPKIEDGELQVYWGRESPGEAPDIIFAWQGDVTMKADSKLLHYHMASRRPDPHVQPIFSKMLPSLVDELIARGYDISTIRFSIKKRKDYDQDA